MAIGAAAFLLLVPLAIIMAGLHAGSQALAYAALADYLAAPLERAALHSLYRHHMVLLALRRGAGAAAGAAAAAGAPGDRAGRQRAEAARAAQPRAAPYRIA